MVRKSPEPKTSLYAFMAYYLRFLRMRHRMTQTQVGEIIGCTYSQISKYEAGTKQLDEKQCESLDEAWNIGGLFSIMLVYAKWGPDLNWPARLLRYQIQASVLRIFSNNLIPLPFQTEDYARGLLGAGYAARLIDDVESAVAKRMEIQARILDGDPEIWLVLDEMALRPMGPPEVMREQYNRLLELERLPNVSIRMLPLSATPNIGVDGSFWCFELPNRRLAAFSGTALDVGRVIDDQTEVAGVAVRFERIAARAWSEDQTREHIAKMGEK